MNSVNLKKRNKLKKYLLLGGLAAVFSIAPLSATKIMSTTNTKQKIIKDKHGRIIKVINNKGIMEFNPQNPMEYKIK